MFWMRTTLRRLKALSRSARIEREIDDELRFHLEMRERDYLAAGLTPEQARAEALRRFGNLEGVKEACRAISLEKLGDKLHLKAIKGFIWVMIGSGLTVRAASSIATVQHAGGILIWIAVLWRVLIYLRAMQSVKHHARASDDRWLILTERVSDESGSLPELPTERTTSQPIPARDQYGRTPVERLLADDE
jgi:hypothetical protein